MECLLVLHSLPDLFLCWESLWSRHQEYLEAFRRLYKTLGQLVYKKEKRLEAATRPLQKTAEQTKEDAEDDDSEEKKSNKRKRSKKKKSKAEAPKMSDVLKDALEQEDEVHEGIDWSDDEE